ncbi:unnamed protein product, partial [Discosporangium mesarthrocarpum]
SFDTYSVRPWKHSESAPEARLSATPTNMSDPTGGNEVFYGLSVVEWSIIGAVSVFFMLLVDRWVHCFRRCTRLCRCKDDRPPLGVDPSEQEVQQPGFTRTYDRDFETGWHVVGLSDETKDEDVHLHRQVQVILMVSTLSSTLYDKPPCVVCRTFHACILCRTHWVDPQIICTHVPCSHHAVKSQDSMGALNAAPCRSLCLPFLVSVPLVAWACCTDNSLQ